MYVSDCDRLLCKRQSVKMLIKSKHAFGKFFYNALLQLNILSWKFVF